MEEYDMEGENAVCACGPASTQANHHYTTINCPSIFSLFHFSFKHQSKLLPPKWQNLSIVLSILFHLSDLSNVYEI